MRLLQFLRYEQDQPVGLFFWHESLRNIYDRVELVYSTDPFAWNHAQSSGLVFIRLKKSKTCSWLKESET